MAFQFFDPRRNMFDRLSDGVNVFNCLTDHLRAFTRKVSGTTGQCMRFFGSITDVRNANRHFFNTCSHIGSGIALLGSCNGHLVCGCRHLRRGIGNLDSASRNLLKIVAQLADQSIELR